MKLLVESIIDCFVDNLNKEIKSNTSKTILAFIFVLFYLFIVSGIFGLGIKGLNYNIIFGIIFILLGILIFIFFAAKFLIIYNKKLNKKLSTKFNLFKIEKKK